MKINAEITNQLAQIWGPFETCPSCKANAFMVEQDLYEDEDDGCNPFSDPQERSETTKKICLVCGYEQEIVTMHGYAEAIVVARRPYQIGGVKPGYSWSTFHIEPHPERGEGALQRWEAGGHEIVLANIALINGRLWLRGSADLFPPEE